MSERDAKKDLEICAKATPGPWEIDHDKIITGYPVMGDSKEMLIKTYLVMESGGSLNGNVQFVAMAREALPYYIEELTKTQAENAAIIAVLKKYKHVIDANDYILCSSEKIMEILSNSSTAGQDLLDRLAQAEKDRDKARAENTKLLQETNELLSRTHRAEQREKQLREALKWALSRVTFQCVGDGYIYQSYKDLLQQTEKEGAE